MTVQRSPYSAAMRAALTTRLCHIADEGADFKMTKKEGRNVNNCCHKKGKNHHFLENRDLDNGRYTAVSKVVAAGGVSSKKSTLRPRSGLTGVAVARPVVAPVLKAPGRGKD